MPTKNRNYYLTTSPSRDFTWFPFKPRTTPKVSRNKTESNPAYRVTKARRLSPLSTVKEPTQALMAPAEVKALAKAVKPKPEAPRPKKPAPKRKSDPKKTGSKNAGPWSDWYVGEDYHYFWRARQTPNETWDYQFTPGYQESPKVQVTSPSTSSSDVSQPLSPSPGHLAASPTLSQVHDPASPKSSWPTIITTSTGHPTEKLSASSGRTLTTLPKELGDGHPAGITGMALVPFLATTPTPRGGNSGNKRKRPVGPVMRLLQESRSRRNKATTTMTKSTVNTTPFDSSKSNLAPQPLQGQYDNSGAVTLTKTSLTAAQAKLAKKLHAKVKSEKELRVDKGRRVRNWLKGVEVDWTPIPLDDQGFPIYL